MNKLILIIISGFICSCQPKTVEEAGGLIIDIEITSNGATENEIDSALKVFKIRIERICENNPQVIVSPDKQKIQIKLPLFVDSTWIRNFVIRKGELRILETHENKDIYNGLTVINHKLIQNQNYNYQFPIILSNAADSFPLFSILNPNVSSSGKLENGPMIGYSSIRDTALIDSIFHDIRFTDDLPQDFDCKWLLNESGNYLWLVAIKKPNRKNITSEMILDARVIKGEITDYEVSFSLKPEYYGVWADLTRANLDRSLALMLDEDVYSSPKIISVIKNGQSAITGISTSEQAEALAAILKYGPIRIDFKIKKITHI